jgi:hypothetical protein
MSQYTSVEAERRDGDDKYYARYNKFKDDEESREKFMTKRENRAEKKMSSKSGKSVDKSDWAVMSREKNGDEDVKSESVDPYKTHTPKSIFKDFNYVDASKLGAYGGCAGCVNGGSTWDYLHFALKYLLVGAFVICIVLIVWYSIVYREVQENVRDFNSDAMLKNAVSTSQIRLIPDSPSLMRTITLKKIASRLGYPTRRQYHWI